MNSNAKLVLREADGKPREFNLGDTPITIGRDSSCELVLQSKYVSRRHVRIEPRDGMFVLAELGSSNPTLVNGEPVSGSRVLAAGDTVSIADVVIEVHLPHDDPNATEVFMVPQTKPPVATPREVQGELTDTERVRVRKLFGMRGTLTIMFTDVENSTQITNQLGDLRAQEFLRTHNALLREAVAKHNGLEVKGQGDGFMVVFTSARSGVRCAVEIQQKLAEYNAKDPEVPIVVRIGLNLGEVIAEDDDFFGTAVILAARIASRADGGEILISELLHNVIAPAGDFTTVRHGSARLKGFNQQHRIYRVEWKAPGAPQP
ncbi:MAG: adenylate/guanylate cyclase domain-containing protein [Dehalococcoidia bacterium]